MCRDKGASAITNHPIIIVGAGICGVSTALWLQRFGHQVTLIDKGDPGMGASFGNSGLLAGWAIDPVTAPTLWRDAPKFLLDRNGPLFLKWRHLPKMSPWLVRFMSHASDAKTQHISRNMASLVVDTLDQHRALVRGTPLENWIHDSPFSFAYPSLKAFEQDHYSWSIKRQFGLEPQILTGPDVQTYEPILGSKIGCLAVVQGQGHVTNPGGYVAALAQQVQAQSGKIIKAELRAIKRTNGKVSAIETDVGPMNCSRLVVTAGIWSKDIMRQLGFSIPLQAERGYHLLFKNPSQTPKHPMLITDGKFGVNAMDMGLRCAGVVELGPHEAAPSKAPLKMIEHHVRLAFPNLGWARTETWHGSRPTLPDSTPVIGEIGSSGIFAGFGHQHVGLTSGPKTGRLLAQMIDGTPPNIDMTPYAARRYLG